MREVIRTFLAAAWVMPIICCDASAQDTSGSKERYTKHIQPFLNKYCVSCHGPKVQKAKLRLDTLDPDIINGSDGDMWQEVLDMVNVGEMPPKEAKRQPDRAERRVAVAALTASLRQAIEAKRSTGGRNVLRRLTAY